MEFSLLSRFSYKYRNYISFCGRFVLEVKESINQDSSDHLNVFHIRIVDTQTQRSKVLSYKARNYVKSQMLRYVESNIKIDNGFYVI